MASEGGEAAGIEGWLGLGGEREEREKGMREREREEKFGNERKTKD